MKTSEFIRNAVDAHLASDRDMERSYYASRFLCMALAFYNNEAKGEYTKQLKAASEVIALEIAEYACQYMVPDPGRITYTIAQISGVDLYDYESIQALRFLFAENIAHYFESLGD